MPPTVEAFSTPEAVVSYLTPSVLNAASKITDREPYERSLEQRIFAERSIKDHERSDTQRKKAFIVREGLYRSPLRFLDPAKEPIQDTEAALTTQIDELLEKKKGTGLPVIVLDFGGGFGISMIRIAYDKYQEAIKNGDLLFVTTNLEDIANNQPDEDGYTGVAKRLNELHKAGESFPSRDDFPFIQENQGLVTYLTADAPELMTRSVKTATGQDIQLAGNIDILHEKGAIAHSEIPDVVLATFTKLLSSNGTLYLGTCAPNYLVDGAMLSRVTNPDGEVIDLKDPQHRKDRELALKVGLTLLLDQGLRKEWYNHYSVFSRPHARNVPQPKW